MRPVVLRADNFTPPSRTPWGGTRLLEGYKRGLDLDPAKAAFPVVGESWELSVEPDFPSVERGSGAALSDIIARDPSAWLGREAEDGRNSTALLVKLLDAADELSVQIHPSDDYAGLSAGESGKPECWYVVERSPGAGVYLGLAEGVTREAMEPALRDGGDVSKLLGFVPVEPGDFLLIEAGTAHAIGRGLTLVEPQRVVPGRRGVTYRYWDWNRRYDSEGRSDPKGQPRALHVEHALAVTNWDAPRGGAFLQRARLRAGEADVEGPAVVTSLCGREGGLASDDLQVARLSGTGVATLPMWGALMGVTVLDGAVTVGDVRLTRGMSAAVPAAMGGAAAQLERAHAVVSAVY